MWPGLLWLKVWFPTGANELAVVGKGVKGFRHIVDKKLQLGGYESLGIHQYVEMEGRQAARGGTVTATSTPLVWTARCPTSIYAVHQTCRN